MSIFQVQTAFRILIHLRGGPVRRDHVALRLGVSLPTVHRVARALLGVGILQTRGRGTDSELALANPLTRAECAAWAASLALPGDVADEFRREFLPC